MNGGRKQADVRRSLSKLDLAGRKQSALETPPTRSPLLGTLGVGRDSVSTGVNANGIDYEATTVTSTDGIFVFEIMVDSTLL